MLQQQAAAATDGAWQALVRYNLAVLLAEEGRVDEALRHAGDALEACATAAAASAAPGGEAASSSVAVSVLELDGEGGAARRQHLITLCLVLLGLLMSARCGTVLVWGGAGGGGCLPVGGDSAVLVGGGVSQGEGEGGMCRDVPSHVCQVRSSGSD